MNGRSAVSSRSGGLLNELEAQGLLCSATTSVFQVGDRIRKTGQGSVQVDVLAWAVASGSAGGSSTGGERERERPDASARTTGSDFSQDVKWER